MTPSDETLMAYVDGELDERARVEVEAAMRANPDIAARIAREQALRKRVRLAFERVIEEPVPERLVAAVRAAPVLHDVGPEAEPAPVRANNVIPLRPRQSRKWSWPEWSSMAASLAVGAVLSVLFVRHTPVGPITSHNGHLFASGALAQALSDQLASTQADVPTTPVRIGVSFRDKSGNYCRTFALREAGSVAGLACRSGGGWQLEAVARSEESADAGAARYRQAGSSLPKPILQSVEDRISGDPLDARAEAAAKASGWKTAAH
jgi:hypothetical protein